MCDYSLHNIRNRLALEGEPLVVHQFFTGSKGMTSPDYIQRDRPRGLMGFLQNILVLPNECAVCIPDGARLRLHDIDSELQSAYGLDSVEVVIFRQLSAAEYSYRDAIEFKNGTKLRLQELRVGQCADVLSLSVPDQEFIEEEQIYPVW